MFDEAITRRSMLRRALLAVVVLSCTFSESIYVHSEKAQRLQIKDLICVLVLSGGQKDDINENALRKLREANVNIHSLNDEKLHKICESNSSSLETLKSELNFTSIQQLIDLIHDIPVNDSSLKHASNKQYENEEQNYDDIDSIIIGRDRRTVDNFEQPTTFSVETDISDTEMLTNTTDKPNLKDVISFWQRIGKKEKDKVTTYMSKDDLSNSTEHYTFPIYTSKQETILTSTTAASSADSMTDNDTDILKYIFDSSDNGNMNEHLNHYSYEINYSKIIYQNKISKQLNTFMENKIKSNYTNDFEDLKSNDPTHNHNSPVRDENVDIDGMERTIREHTSERPNVTEFNMFHNEYTTSALPPDTIKKIAEDVKALILKDLHKHLIETTTEKLPLFTLEGLAQLTPMYIAAKNFKKSQVLEKILDILQNYKNNNNNTDAYITGKNDRDAVHYTPNIPHFLLPVGYNLMKSNTISPHLNPYHSYKSGYSQKVASRLKLEGPKPRSFVKSNNISNHFKLNPIKLQTNMIEIPPLGVPVSDPLTILNHNVIISTKHPFRQKHSYMPLSKNHKYNNFKKNRPVRIHKDNSPRNRDFRHDNYYYSEKNRNQHKIMYNERKPNNYVEEIENRYPRSKSYRIGHPNKLRFHEKLEQYDPNDNYNGGRTDDCCKDEIFTSEHHAHSDMSEETSFTNLLKSQQRVTDMLAQLLAKKTTERRPLSVETA